MDLLALDENFQPVQYLKYINLQWTRKYYECGDFSIQMAASEYKDSMKYIYCPVRPETGIIQKIEYEQTYKGKIIQISGFFLERILWDKIIFPTYYANGRLEDSARDIVNKYKDDIPLLELGQKVLSGDVGNSVVWQETGGEIGDVLYTRLQTQQLSQRCRYDFQANKIYYEVWQGLNRTQAQSENNFVVFSTKFRNMQQATVTTDSSNYKNYFIVGGADEVKDNDNTRIYVYVDLSGGGYKRELFVDQKSMSWDSEKQSLDEYKQSLYEKGVEKSIDYVNTINIEVEGQNTVFKYLDDYDIGDICDVIVEDLNLSMTARIIEVDEVFKQNQHNVTLVLGDKIVTSMQKVRMRG